MTNNRTPDTIPTQKSDQNVVAKNMATAYNEHSRVRKIKRLLAELEDS